MALFGGTGGGGFSSLGKARGSQGIGLKDARKYQQASSFFQNYPKKPDESLDYFVDPSVTGATTYTNQPPPQPDYSNAYRLAQMRAAAPGPRNTTMMSQRRGIFPAAGY